MHEKEIEKLQAEKEKIEQQLAQEQHKVQRLENRAAYYEKGERRKRAHRRHHPWCSHHRERRTADKGFERKRVLCFCRTGLCADRHAKIAHKNRQRSCGR